MANKVILRILKKFALELEPQLEQFSDELKEKNISFEDVMNSKTYYEFDSAITAKLHGLKSAADYYKRSGVSNELYKVAIPILALSSLDDPIIDSTAIPYEEIANTSNIILATTTTGGHVG